MHDPTIQTNHGWTVAMCIADDCKMIPPKEWEHGPQIRTKSGWTVALNLADNGIIPPKQWLHNKYFRCRNEFD